MAVLCYITRGLESPMVDGQIRGGHPETSCGILQLLQRGKSKHREDDEGRDGQAKAKDIEYAPVSGCCWPQALGWN